MPWNGEAEGCSSPPCPPVSPWIIGAPNNEVEVKTSEDASVVRPPLYDTL
jgi:hypothetical protein